MCALRIGHHTEISTPTRAFQPHPSRAPLLVSQNTPFLFNCPVPTPPHSSFRFDKYDPNDFTPRNLGFQPTVPSEDVDMSDSPAKDTPQTPAKVDNEVEERPIAKGAVTRVRKKREKEWKNRQVCGHELAESRNR
jgi:hypothetical protein